jgi:hypothetical protein
LQLLASLSAAVFNFAAGVSTAVILAILAGVKPLEQMYRDRNQSCRLVIEATHGSLTPDLVKRTLEVRTGQIKRFVVKPGEEEGIDEVTLILSRVACSNRRRKAAKPVKRQSGEYRNPPR